MAQPYFISGNFSAITFGYSSPSSTTYPLSNIVTYYASDVWQSAANVAAGGSFTATFASATACDCLVIAGHNFASFATNIDLEAADSADFMSGNITVIDSLQANCTSLPIAKTFNSVSKRYWRLTFDDDSLPAQIGNFFLGTKMSFDTSYDWDYSIGNKSYQTQVSESLDGRKRMSQIFSGKPVHRISFNLQSDTVKTNLQTFVETIRGGLYPFYFVDAYGAVWLVRLSDDFADIVSHRYNVNNVSMTLEAVEI